MFGDLGDDVVAALAIHLGNALEREVVRLGGTGGEDDLLGGGPDQLGDLSACGLNGGLSLPAKLMIAAGGIAELAGEVGQHGFEDPRVHGRGGVVIHIEGKVHALGKRGCGVGDDYSAVAHVAGCAVLADTVFNAHVLLLCRSNLFCLAARE